jgi:predicted nuclease with TOPRIM domain
VSEPVILALLGVAGGAVGLEIVKRVASRGEASQADSVTIRQEWRAEVSELRKRVTHLEDQLTEWIGRYTALQVEHARLMEAAGAMRAELDQLRKRVGDKE